MSDRKLTKGEYRSYFDIVSRSLQGRLVEIEVAGLDIGDQIEQKWVQLKGLSYDPDGDSFFVHTATLVHQISQPREITAVESGVVLTAVGVTDSFGHLQVIRLGEPLMLAAVAESSQMSQIGEERGV